MEQPPDVNRPPISLVAVLLAATAFAAAYGQAPLYYSNQNQYFLHGLARAGVGLLSEDWLARTLDPTPIFSALAAGTIQFLHPWLFHVYHALLQGAYAAGLLGLFVALAGKDVARRRWPVFEALLVLIHSAGIRWCSYRLLGQDYPWYFQAGVAGQYILGGMFQPSVFGVLLVVAVSLFVLDRPLAAAVCLGVAATVHATYLLPAALLTLGFAAALWSEGRLRLALGVGVLALVLVLPVIVFALLTFGPTSPADFAEGQRILIDVRIPHHSLPRLWLDEMAMGQIAWLVLGLACSWRTRLFMVLAVALALGAVLTVLQVMTDSRTLALLFPWRISSVLMPVATAVLLSRLVAVVSLPLDGKLVQGVAVSLLLVLAIAGVWISVGRLAFHMADEELQVMDFVRETKKPGDVYLLPVRIHAPSRGSPSGDFKPIQAKRQDARLISVDLQRFRLSTGAPIFVDFKSIPYKDVEVIEWYRRMQWAQVVQEQIRAGQLSDAAVQLREGGVTHLVLPASQELPAPEFRLVHQDPFYRVYQLVPGDAIAVSKPASSPTPP